MRLLVTPTKERLAVQVVQSHRNVNEFTSTPEYSHLGLTGASSDEAMSREAIHVMLHKKSVEYTSWLRKSKQETWRKFSQLHRTFRGDRAYIGGDTCDDAYWRISIRDTTFRKECFGSFEKTSTEEVGHVLRWSQDLSNETWFPSAPDTKNSSVWERHKLRKAIYGGQRHAVDSQCCQSPIVQGGRHSATFENNDWGSPIKRRPTGVLLRLLETHKIDCPPRHW